MEWKSILFSRKHAAASLLQCRQGHSHRPQRSLGHVAAEKHEALFSPVCVTSTFERKKRRFFDCCRLANNEAIITTSHLICSPNILNALAVIFLLHFSLGSTWCFTLLSLVFLESCVKVQTAVPWHTSDLTWSAFTLISNFPTCENEHRKQGMKNSDKHGSCAPIYSTNGAALRPSLKTDLIPRSSAPAKANGVRSNTSAAQEVPRYPLERPAPR